MIRNSNKWMHRNRERERERERERVASVDDVKATTLKENKYKI